MLLTSFLKKVIGSNLSLFIILLLLIFWMQYDLLGPAMEVGITPDDWSFIFFYKLLGTNPLSKFAEVWAVNGPYTTVPIFYTGFIHSIFGFDFFKIQLIGILFKTLATLVLFPLTLLVFKNRLLAILTTVFFAMSYPSSGALETIVEPSEYLGMFSMGLFLIAYYHIVKNNLLTLKWLWLTTTLLIITIMLSVMRLYPLLVLILLIEFYLFVQKRSILTLKKSFLRISVLFSPFILITLFSPSVIVSYVGVLPTVLQRILEGNWHLILTPLQGFGHTLPISVNLWKILGLVNMENFGDYVFFILGGPTVIFSLIILFLVFFTSVNRWRFFLLTFCLNFILEILLFFIATHYLSIPIGSRIDFDSLRIYSTFFGLIILVLAFAYWIEWNTVGRKNNLLLALWISPIVAFVFISLTWVLAGINLRFGQGAHDHYLMIPSVGISIFIAGLLTLIYEKSKVIKLGFVKWALRGVIFFILVAFYLFNRDLIHSYFNHANENGRAALGQHLLQSRFRDKIKSIDLSKPTLFYFDTSELSGNGPFYTEGLLSSSPFFMRFQGNELIDGCSERLYFNEHKQLIPYIKEQNGQKGFLYQGLCIESGKGGYKNIFYTPDNFYAFKLKNKDFIDIKEDLLRELGF